MIHLPDKGGRYPYQLSGGQQQRVALARALAIEPEVLLLDEPLSALDAKIRVALRKEIRSIQRQLGITTVYVTHDQEEAMSLSDRVVVMSEGRVEQIGPPPEIYNFPATPFVASFVGTLNLLPAKVVDAAGGLVSIAGQTIRTPKAIESGGGSARHGRAPAGGGRDRRGRRHEPAARQGRGRQLPRLDRPDPGQGGRGRRLVSLDQFNDPALAAPALGETITISFPAEATLVLGRQGRRRQGRSSRRSPRTLIRAAARSRRRGGPCAPPGPRRDRPRRLRQGRDADLVRGDVGRLGPRPRDPARARDPAARRRRRLHDDRLRPGRRAGSSRAGRSRSGR